MNRRIRSWSLTPRRARRLQSGHLILAGIVGAVLLAVIVWMLSPEPQPDVMVADAGPAEPPCPYLLRVADKEQRCDPAVVAIDQPQVGVDLLMPAMPKTCRPIVSDARGRLYPLTFEVKGTGLRGSIGPLPEQATPYTLRFISWDERVAKEEACLQWSDYSIQLLRAPPPEDAGPAKDIQP